MPPGSLEDVAAAVDGQLVPSVTARPWSGRLHIDSREIRPGDAFLALPGQQRDGHEFVAPALEAGAAFAIVQRARAVPANGPQILVADPLQALNALARWHRQRSDSLIIGVTGSVGKTTTRELIHTALSSTYHGVRSEKNHNNEIGLPLSLLSIQAEHEFAVLEMGAARIGDIFKLTELAQPEIGVITAIGPAHLASFGSLEGVMQAKGELLESLPGNGIAVLSGDCSFQRAMASRSRGRIIFVGTGGENDFQITREEQTARGWKFQVDGQKYDLPVISRHHLQNALSAIAIGTEIGIASNLLAERLAGFVPVSGRSQILQIGPWSVIDDTYNASPLSFHAAVNTLANLPAPPRTRRIVIAGDMLELGHTAREEHRRLGDRIGRSGVDRLIVTGHHADDVAHGAIAAGLPAHLIAAAIDWETVLFMLECWLEPGDLILVKGSRGMRMERILDWMKRVAAEDESCRLRKCA